MIKQIDFLKCRNVLWIKKEWQEKGMQKSGSRRGDYSLNLPNCFNLSTILLILFRIQIEFHYLNLH